MSLTEKQIKERRGYIGASESAAILGLSNWSSPLKVWSEKTSALPHEDLSDREAIELGNELEDYVARRFCQKTGKKVHRVNATLYHKDHPFIACNLDRQVVDEKVPLECKTAGEFMAKDWKGDVAPNAYVVQVMHQMAVTGAPYAYLAVLIGNREFKWLKVDRDEDMIKTIVEREVAFWNTFVVPKIMPKVIRQDNETLARLFKDAVDEVIPLDDDARRTIESLQGMKADYKDLEGKIDLLGNKLKAMLGDKLAGTTGNWRVMWKPQTQERIDVKKFKDEQPELSKKYIKETTFRKLTIKENE